ncbi:MAG TPA: ABC transporter ATP-binding protein [Dehalococcoidia bacterium]|nr:ABC transporter ATP-binding protein [Dehalococcoidia bacterium]
MRTAFDQVEIAFEEVTKRYALRDGRTLREFASSLVSRRPFTNQFCALQDVTFSISRGETVALIGRNGSGKSTALKLMAGVTAPSSGQVYIGGRISPLIELGAGFHPDLTGRENVHLNASILGMSGREIKEQFDAIVQFAELEEFIDTPIKRYSSGMYVRLGFAVAVHSNPEILLVDEVLAVGDAFFQEKCLEKMHDFRSRGVTIVLVSHSTALVSEFCERAIWLDHGHMLGDGPAKEIVQRYIETVPHAAGVGV